MTAGRRPWWPRMAGLQPLSTRAFGPRLRRLTALTALATRPLIATKRSTVRCGQSVCKCHAEKFRSAIFARILTAVHRWGSSGRRRSTAHPPGRSAAEDGGGETFLARARNGRTGVPARQAARGGKPRGRKSIRPPLRLRRSRRSRPSTRSRHERPHESRALNSALRRRRGGHQTDRTRGPALRAREKKPQRTQGSLAASRNQRRTGHRAGAIVGVEESVAAHRSAVSTAVKESQSLAITLRDATSARRAHPR